MTAGSQLLAAAVARLARLAPHFAAAATARAVPAGVADGDRFSFSVSLPRGPRTRVNVRVMLS